ncbi:MAG: phosphoglycerate kinase [Chloroflexota bacterium]
MDKMTVRDMDVIRKRVLMRVDFNVPLDEKTGAITDDSRIRATVPTIKYLTQRGARVILMSHLGRPKGKVVSELRMLPVAQRTSQILGQQVGVATDCVGVEVEKSVEKLQSGDVLLLENLRFHSEEEDNTDSFARQLSQLAEIYVDDAFGTAHRAHASVTGVAKYLPAVAGLLMEKEINTLSGILEKPALPFAAILGGAKISDKVEMMENILSKVSTVLIGGGMANNFLKAKNYETGKSLIEDGVNDLVVKLIADMEKRGINLLLPTDVVVADEVKPDVKTQVVAVGDVKQNSRILDIGPQTIENFSRELRKCQTIFWNGPMGLYEIPPFALGTRTLARLLAGLKATTVIGGGSTAEVVIEMNLDDKMTFVSTGGGASLSFLGGEQLPGVEALRDKI